MRTSKTFGSVVITDDFFIGLIFSKFKERMLFRYGGFYVRGSAGDEEPNCMPGDFWTFRTSGLNILPPKILQHPRTRFCWRDLRISFADQTQAFNDGLPQQHPTLGDAPGTGGQTGGSAGGKITQATSGD